MVRLGKQLSTSDIFIPYNKKFIIVQEAEWPRELTLLVDEEGKIANTDGIELVVKCCEAR